MSERSLPAEPKQSSLTLTNEFSFARGYVLVMSIPDLNDKGEYFFLFCSLNLSSGFYRFLPFIPPYSADMVIPPGPVTPSREATHIQRSTPDRPFPLFMLVQ